MKKEFKITREQILKLVHGSSIDNLEKWFPEVFKTELEVGKVYKYTDSGSYGFTTNGNWCENLGVCKQDKYTEATTEEWQSALIEEAKRRGLYDAEHFKHANTLTSNYNVNTFLPTVGSDSVWTKYGCIFHKGIWAEIIKTISKEEAEKQLGLKII
jgi:hypothetical protein